MAEQETFVRGARAKERLKDIKNHQPNRPGIRVEPRDDIVRKHIKHPSGIRFRPTGSIEWPNDRFTQRRLRDGDVKLVQTQSEQSSGVEDSLRHHHKS